MTNPTVMLPPRARGIAYLVYALLALAVGTAAVGYAAAGLPQPVELKVIAAMLLFVGSGLGVTAASNTPNAPSSQLSPQTPPTDGGEGDGADGDDAGEQPAG